MCYYSQEGPPPLGACSWHSEQTQAASGGSGRPAHQGTWRGQVLSQRQAGIHLDWHVSSLTPTACSFCGVSGGAFFPQAPAAPRRPSSEGPPVVCVLQVARVSWLLRSKCVVRWVIRCVVRCVVRCVCGAPVPAELVRDELGEQCHSTSCL